MNRYFIQFRSGRGVYVNADRVVIEGWTRGFYLSEVLVLAVNEYEVECVNVMPTDNG